MMSSPMNSKVETQIKEPRFSWAAWISPSVTGWYSQFQPVGFLTRFL